MHGRAGIMPLPLADVRDIIGLVGHVRRGSGKDLLVDDRQCSVQITCGGPLSRRCLS
jgi:hypothetical protein